MKRKGAVFLKKEGDSVLYTGSYVDRWYWNYGSIQLGGDCCGSWCLYAL